MTSTGQVPLPSAPGKFQFSVAWSSDEHGMGGTGRAATPDDPWVRECWEAARIDAPVPRACLSREVLFAETGSMAASPWASFGLILAVLAAVGVIAMRFVGRVPRIARAVPVTLAGAGASAGTGAGSAPLTAAVRRATDDKARFGAANAALMRFTEPGYGRRLFWRGALAGLAWVLALGFTVGFVTAGEWGMLASLLLLLAVIVAYLAATLLTDNLTNVVHIRALFALGVATGFILGAVAGSVVLDPLIEWDGVQWLF
ncbi:MAG: hypothetical protein GEU80_11255 [Dehalococcoidia bacterium]|nr:hypothetical protein [Dehalococcoidia bacterium]